MRLGANILLNCCLIAAGQFSYEVCLAQTSESQTVESRSIVTNEDGSAEATVPVPTKIKDDVPQPGDDDNAIGLSFLKHLLSDQKAIWTSPSRLHWDDGTWLFPLAGLTAGFFATDRAVPPALSTNPNTLNRFVKVSNYGLYSMLGAGGGFYMWSKISHDDHQRETGILATEAAINSLAVNTALQYSFGRERPYQGGGLGDFFQHGTSFPSEHSAVAWSIASVIAHEYPGTFTQMLVYGLATAVSATRVAGAQHFPSDVVVGGAIGWLIGRQVYHAHHDPDLGGTGWDPLSGNDDREENRDRRRMGSPSVPLDSWVYPAFERLAALQAINTQIMGVKPWTRMECARLTEEVSETLQQGHVFNVEQVARLQTQLAQEFNYEINLLGGVRYLTANLVWVYARAVSISGPALNDSYHYGQTISDDFGRPFARGTNGQVGGSFSADAGPLTLYVRAEYQHAPSAPAPSSAVVNFISQSDGGVPIVGDMAIPLSEVPAGPVEPINRLQLLDSYVGVNLNNWQLTLGRQSLSWTPGPEGSMSWSDNIEPVNMVRFVNSEPLHLTNFLRFLGPIRIDHFFGRLEGHPYVPRPFIYGQKINVKPFSFLELGFGRTIEIGGVGGNALTTGNFLRSFFGRNDPQYNSVPGHNQSEMDWTFYVPKVRNYIVLYGDTVAADDVLPIENPVRNPWHPGIYITRFPGIPKLDFHLEGVSTESPCAIIGPGNHGCGGNFGNYTYWNSSYPDGETNNGNLIGNTVGRDGRTIQAQLRYWISPRNTVTFTYKHNTVSPDFVPQGGAWQDYTLSNETHLQNGFYVKSEFQYENISRFPILFSGPQKNITAVVEMGYMPARKNRNDP